ncbi:MAG TPA: carboxypeptidase-like regulatory domain-containing protein [Flavobacterium sp.]|uniref:carboxypeptidase-like regulatory domain-containing protein n=1 Tax=Flavobacterium sp. TaxID=239 RepID=UPI002B4ACA62|nr:carboxypeptidase-like regulatory domain-containing protein [Flavobacterium sp.]HLO73172.1 carboxypeptidase-like regulatory domain-containing protein [Flavobacterium sp.]
MAKKINISIPEPCHENWEGMSLVDKGRYCHSCSKVVFDFTKASDKEIIAHLNNNKNTCGRFLNVQLNRDLIVTKQKSSYWVIATTGLLSFFGVGSHNSYAQVKQDTIQTDKVTSLTKDSILNPNLLHKVTGIVTDELGPVLEANVFVKGTIRETKTDFDGKFEIEVTDGEILIATFLGSKKEIQIEKNKNNYEIIFDPPMFLGEIVYIEKRTFIGRQIQSIRNWFR